VFGVEYVPNACKVVVVVVEICNVAFVDVNVVVKRNEEGWRKARAIWTD
jgi:hypothetical protein